MNNTFRHATIDVTGPKELWSALGYQPYSNTDVVGGQLKLEDSLIIMGIVATGANDQRALAWALNERQRREEEGRRFRAQLGEATAIKSLADAIAQSAEEGALERIIGRHPNVLNTPSANN